MSTDTTSIFDRRIHMKLSVIDSEGSPPSGHVSYPHAHIIKIELSSKSES